MNPADNLRRFLLIAVCFVLITRSLASAQILTVLHSFDGSDGAFPADETLAQGRDGNLYGVTNGGTFSDGTVFRITPRGALSFFTFDGTNGSQPVAGLALGRDGLLRGVTEFGGDSGDGILFSIGPQAPIAILADFDGANGEIPAAAVTSGVDGNWYGTTALGGANDSGTVFKLTPSGTLTILYSFGTAIGPLGLVYGPDRAFYGETGGGGLSGLGTVFRVTPSGNLTTIYNFDGTHGAGPQGTLLLASDGNFYGTATSGGDLDLGTLFRLDPAGVTVLHSFDGADGQMPTGALIQATDGNLYGTTSRGGTLGFGTIFSITMSGAYTVVYNFDKTHGSFPGGLMQHTNGQLYGTTGEGGSQCDSGFGCGTVFSLDMGLGPFITFVLPFGRVGSGVQILGQGLTGTTAVTFNGAPATTFNVVSDTFMGAIVPPGATTGRVQVTTPTGVLTSNVNLQIVP